MTKSEYNDHIIYTDDNKLSVYSQNAKQAVMGNKWGDFFSAAEAPPHLVKDTKLLILSLLKDKDGDGEIGLVGKVKDKEETDIKLIVVIVVAIIGCSVAVVFSIIIIILLVCLVKKKRSVKREPKKLKKDTKKDKKKETDTETSDEEDDSTNKKKRKEKGKHGKVAKKEEHEKMKEPEPEKKIVRHGMTKSEYTAHLVYTEATKLSQYSKNAKKAVMGNKWGDPHGPLPVFPPPRHSHY